METVLVSIFLEKPPLTNPVHYVVIQKCKVKELLSLSNKLLGVVDNRNCRQLVMLRLEKARNGVDIQWQDFHPYLLGRLGQQVTISWWTQAQTLYIPFLSIKKGSDLHQTYWGSIHTAVSPPFNPAQKHVKNRTTYKTPWVKYSIFYGVGEIKVVFASWFFQLFIFFLNKKIQTHH